MDSLDEAKKLVRAALKDYSEQLRFARAAELARSRRYLEAEGLLAPKGRVSADPQDLDLLARIAAQQRQYARARRAPACQAVACARHAPARAGDATTRARHAPARHAPACHAVACARRAPARARDATGRSSQATARGDYTAARGGHAAASSARGA